MMPQLAEPLNPTLVGFVLVMLVFNLAWYLAIRYLQSGNTAGVRHESEGSTDSYGPRDGPDGDTVRCLECETENARGYRYCRSCASTLPGVGGASQMGDLSFGRIVR